MKDNKIQIFFRNLLKSISLSVLKNMLRLKQLLINNVRCQIILTNHKDFRRSKPTGLGLICLYLPKKLITNPNKGIIIIRPKTLVTKVPPFLNIIQANFKADKHKSIYVKASLDQFVPTFGAPSFKTTSALLSLNYSFN